MRRNPFEILGITPEMVKKLDDDHLFALVRSSYRVLQKVLHPDANIGKKARRSERIHRQAVEVNEAFERLDLARNPDSFQDCRERYTPRPKRGLRKELDQTRERADRLDVVNEELSYRFLDFLYHFLDHGPGRWGALPNGKRPHVFDLRNLRIGLYDVAVGYNLRHSSWNLGRNYKEMRFDEEGKMNYRLLSRGSFAEVRYIRLLGSVDVDRIDLIPHLNKKAGAGCGENGSFCADLLYQESEKVNTISLSNFREVCLPNLTPYLKENAYLFSIHLENGGSVLKHVPVEVWLEGKIIKLDLESGTD